MSNSTPLSLVFIEGARRGFSAELQHAKHLKLTYGNLQEATCQRGGLGWSADQVGLADGPLGPTDLKFDW